MAAYGLGLRVRPGEGNQGQMQPWGLQAGPRWWDRAGDEQGSQAPGPGLAVEHLGCGWSWSSAGQTLGPQLEAAARDRGSAPATSSCSVVPVSPEGREQPPAALSVSCQSPGSRTPSSGEGTCRALHHHPPHVRCLIMICSGESLCSVLQFLG